MARVCMAASGTGTLAFIGAFTVDEGNGMNAEVCRFPNRVADSVKCIKTDGTTFIF